MEKLSVAEFQYTLPEERIASVPVSPRDASKLLVYKNGVIEHDTFFHLAHHLPPSSLLVMNNTKVIPARLLFKNEHGATIEIFLMRPLAENRIHTGLQQTHEAVWECLVGNAKKWKEPVLELSKENKTIRASWINREKGHVLLAWTEGNTLRDMLLLFGHVPLPPYIKRADTEQDQTRYQTTYGKEDGAVAAPTAGLHFTDSVFSSLQKKNIACVEITLHVGAGTFLPMKADNAHDHVMHREEMQFTRIAIEKILQTESIVAVGTTSLRSLESLYWFGVLLAKNPNADFFIPQNIYFDVANASVSKHESLENVLAYMKKNKLETLSGNTCLFVRPPYHFHLCDKLITNFHQPGSTLLLLVAAFVGYDWKKIYHTALENKYRFLSYGDSSLLYSEKKQ